MPRAHGWDRDQDAGSQVFLGFTKSEFSTRSVRRVVTAEEESVYSFCSLWPTGLESPLLSPAPHNRQAGLSSHYSRCEKVTLSQTHPALKNFCSFPFLRRSLSRVGHERFKAVSSSSSFFFLGLHLQHMEVPRLGVNQSYSCQPTP